MDKMKILLQQLNLTDVQYFSLLNLATLVVGLLGKRPFLLYSCLYICRLFWPFTIAFRFATAMYGYLPSIWYFMAGVSRYIYC